MAAMANNDELGYIFLEHCVLWLTPSASGLPSLEWMNLDFYNEESASVCCKDLDNAGSSCARCEVMIDAADENEPDENTDDESSRRCELRLVNHSIRFSGFASDMKPDRTCCSEQCFSVRRNRTDAALLLGLALTCHDLGHIIIQKACILFKEDSEAAIGGDVDNDICGLTSRRADFYLTVSLPQYATFSERSKIPTGNSRRTATKPMPASSQLLLSMIRSDWQRLDKMVQASTTPVACKVAISESPALFPETLTLEDLYIRIRGLSAEPDERHPKGKELNLNSCLMTSLPKEILVCHISPYLRARSLDSLRSTCWYLHEALRFVVPGLKLSLYSHQIRSLKWMRMRECRHVSETDILENPKSLSLQRTGADLHRAVTGGATVALVPRPFGADVSIGSNLFRISQEYGQQISEAAYNTFERNVARGGLLCDDPGLGKTITVISLILQTVGLTTESPHEPGPQSRRKDPADEILDAYWREIMTAEFRRPSLFKLYRRLQRTDDGVRFFAAEDAESRTSQSHPEDNSISLFVISKKIERDEYKNSFWLFCEDVKRCIRNVRREYLPFDDMYAVATRLSKLFDALVEEFKEKQIASARKSFSNAMAKPNSLVAALLDKQARAQYSNALVPSKSTLLVVPSTLMDHWENQIRLHVDLIYCSGKDTLIFSFGEEKSAEKRHKRIDQTFLDCAINKSKYAFVFLDKSTVKPLPQPDFLAMFDIVITTTQRFTNEWKNGSFQDELRCRKEADSTNFEYDSIDSFQQSEKACPLLKVRWLRMIVDEGHSMGRGKTSSSILFASWISAERRWAMTGTPTRQTIGDCGISNVSFLMRYLQHDFFCSRLDGEKVWKQLIAKGWKEGCLASFFRLSALLGFLMIRHTKRDIEELPRPHFRKTVLPMSKEEVKAYNSLVWGVQSNLVLTSMEAETSGMQDSLLDPSQFQHAFQAMSNIRLACGCGGTKIITKIPQRFQDETMSMLESCHLPDFKLKVVNDHIHRAKFEEYSSCMVCGLQLLALLIVPCGDLVCSECMTSDTRACPVCDEPFNIDFFQQLQPGFTIEWKPGDDDNDRAESPEAQDELDFAVAMESGSSGVHELGTPRRRTRRPRDGHICQYSPKYLDGKCKHCLEQHGSCVLVESRSRCAVCYRVAEQCPKDESKATYVIDKLLDLHRNQRFLRNDLPSHSINFSFGDHHPANLRPLKAIVFSQFRKVLNMVGDRLLRRLGGGCVAEYWGNVRQQELRKFSTDPNCFCMFLGKDGSEGLDLSFVTHIFFLEQVWDKSLQQQTVARAWRMGTKGHVEVETLISEKTVEELMSKLEQQGSNQDNTVKSLGTDAESVLNASETGSTDTYRRAKLHFLLKNLRLIRDDNGLEHPLKSKAKRKRRVVWDETEKAAVRLRVESHESS